MDDAEEAGKPAGSPVRAPVDDAGGADCNRSDRTEVAVRTYEAGNRRGGGESRVAGGA